MLLQSAKAIAAGIAVSAISGAGVGIGCTEHECAVAGLGDVVVAVSNIKSRSNRCGAAGDIERGGLEKIDGRIAPRIVAAEVIGRNAS